MGPLLLPFLVACLVSLTNGQGAACPYAKYVGANEVHTMCLPPNSSCRIVNSGVSQSDQNLIVKLHNDIRNRVASGQQVIKNGAKLPQAADMRLLIWNPELAKIAQAHANQCTLTFECSNCRSTDDYAVSENLYYSYSQNPPPRTQWQQTINFWNSGAKNTESVNYTPNRPGSFAQMIWGLTNNIGCGFTRFRGDPRQARYLDYYVCMYGPAGNYVNMDTYEAGSPCSDCAFGETCCGNKCSTGSTPAYPYLCQ